MQPYFDPTRMSTSKKNGRLPQKKLIKMEDNLQKKKKWKTTSKKKEKGNQLKFYFQELE
jgi:hypothetical protein